jgi:hypothetical protein
MSFFKVMGSFLKLLSLVMRFAVVCSVFTFWIDLEDRGENMPRKFFTYIPQNNPCYEYHSNYAFPHRYAIYITP